MQGSTKLILFGVGLIAAIGIFDALSVPEPAPTKNTTVAEPIAAETRVAAAARSEPVGISGIASDPYTRDQYPKTFAKFGSAVQAINADRRKAAKIAAHHRDCDFVENAQVTTQTPMQNRRYWVECSNLTRLFFDEESLARGEPVDVQTKEVWIRDGLKDW